jgi:outer membrane protein assembly factor BamB
MFRSNSSRNSYVPDVKGPETNNTIWTFNTTNSNAGNGAFSSATIIGEKVYIGSGGGQLFCLNLTTGAHYWNYSTGKFHGQSCSPAVYDDVVFIGNDVVPQLWAINATSGDNIWNFTFNTGFMKGIYSSPAAVDGKVYFGTDNGSGQDRVYCLPVIDPNSDGDITSSEIIWEFDAPDKVWSSPAIIGDKVYVGCGKGNNNNNKLYCLNADDGSIN